MTTTELRRGPGVSTASTLLTVLLAAGVGLAGVSAAAAQGNAPKKGAIIDKGLQASDGWPIAITYWESTEGQEAPVVILLHRKGGNRLVWKQGFAKRLQGMGFAVIAVDLRKHGDSKPPGAKGKLLGRITARDYRAMGRDLEAVKDFIFQEHEKKKLNMRKTAIIAPEESAPIALAYTLYDWSKAPYDDGPTPALSTPRGQDIRALILLSPKETVPGVNGTQPLTKLRHLPIAFAIAYGKGDVVDRGKAARKMLDVLTAVASARRRVFKREYKTKARGTDLLGRRLGAEKEFGAFLTDYVKNARFQWRERRSKLDR